MKILEDNILQEEFIQKSRIRTQKVYCPMNLTFIGIDSNTIDTSKKIIYIGFGREKILRIFPPNPDELLKPYSQPAIISKLFFIITFLLSCSSTYFVLQPNVNRKKGEFVLNQIIFIGILQIFFYSIAFLVKAKGKSSEFNSLLN